jgi:flavorubredoxin
MDSSSTTSRHRVPVTRIDPDTHLIHQVQGTLDPAYAFYVNSMVITGREPAVIDTGTSSSAADWLEDVSGIVDPADVRWIVLSHDDADHAGNLAAMISACPNAVLACSREVFDRHPDDLGSVPPSRRRWIDEGDRLDVGDRHLLIVRPPVRDALPTLGVLDERSGVYWSADAFACLLTDQPVETVTELEPELWTHGMAVFVDHLLSPSLDLIDEVRFATRCDQVQALGMTTIASAHSPLITEPAIDQAFARLRALPRSAGAFDGDRLLLDRPGRGGHVADLHRT